MSTVAVPFAPQVFTDGLELADLHVRAEVAAVVAELADRARQPERPLPEGVHAGASGRRRHAVRAEERSVAHRMFTCR